MIHIIQPQTPNVVAILHADGTQQLLHGIHVVCDFGREYRAIDQVCFDLLAFEAVEADVAGRVDQLAQVDAVVLDGDESDYMCCFGGHVCELFKVGGELFLGLGVAG